MILAKRSGSTEKLKTTCCSRPEGLAPNIHHKLFKVTLPVTGMINSRVEASWCSRVLGKRNTWNWLQNWLCKKLRLGMRHYYGTKTVLDWIFAHYFFGSRHHAWVAAEFYPYRRNNPRSSNPLLLYEEFYEAWRDRDDDNAMVA